MVINLTEQSTLLEIFKSQRMTSASALQLVQYIVHLEKHKGIRFVCNYLKGLRSYLLKGEVIDQHIRRRADGSLYGALLPLWKMARSCRKGHIRVERILRVYGRYEHPQPEVVDYIKFATAVRMASPSGDELKVQLTIPELRAGSQAARAAKFDLNLPVSAVKKTPLVGKLEIETLPMEHYQVLQEYAPGILIRNGDLFNLIYPLYYAENDSAVYSAADESTTYRDGKLVRTLADNVGYPLTELVHDLVGSVVGLTKDRGYKLRFIANPHRLIQLALSRLKDAFETVLKQMPESSVYNQQSGISWAQSKLIEGQKLWSVDLSAATDNFPFSFQESIARQLFGDCLEPDINLWRDVVYASWTTPVAFNPGSLTGVRQLDYPTVSYGRGQPMGVAPSFAAFTVSHISLLRALGGNQNTFRVLGDDVLICDKKLFEAYMVALNLLNVPISPAKSLFESDVGEFAGRLVDKYGPWPAYKASKLSIKSDPLGYIRQYGSRIMVNLPLGKYKKELIKFFSGLPGYGFDHTLDEENFCSLSSEQLLILYPVKSEEMLPLGDNLPIADYALTGIKPFHPVFEPKARGLGFLGNLPHRNNLSLVEHLNVNARDPDSVMHPAIRELWVKDSNLSADLVKAWEEDTPLPLAHLKKIYKRILRV